MATGNSLWSTINTWEAFNEQQCQTKQAYFGIKKGFSPLSCKENLYRISIHILVLEHSQFSSWPPLLFLYFRLL